MNMLRVGGTMVYESDDFYDLCDELGILVWQDFMFANMDYPEDDAAFVASVVDEATQLLARLQARPEPRRAVRQLRGRAAGGDVGRAARALEPAPVPRGARRRSRARVCPDVPYWPSSAHGGAFPHGASEGTTSYYGVGAYLRPLEDARRAEVRFASECLAFANVPGHGALPGGPTAARAPRRRGRRARRATSAPAGTSTTSATTTSARLFGVDPVALR